MFNRMSLQTKLLSLSGFMSVLLATVGGMAFYSLRHIDAIYNTVSKTNIPNLTYLVDVESDEREINIYMNGMAAEKSGSANFVRMQKALDESMKDLEKSIKTYEVQPFGPGEETLWKAAKASLGKFTAFVESFRALAADESRDNSKELVRRANEERPTLHRDFAANFDKLQDRTNKNTDDVLNSADATIALAYKLIGFGGVVGILLALVFGFLTARTLSKTLLGIATRLTTNSREVSAATHSIAEAGTELSASATEQAAALQQTVASLEEVSAMVNKSAENARRSLDSSAKSQDAAEKGKTAVQEMIGSIGEINRSNTEIMGQIEASNREISEIVKVIAEIGNKTKVINDIVFQTKLLSFNASVEAARAGEHGKGFAVVAEEVGNLAQMSGNAAKEISGMLEESMRKVQGIADDTKTKVEKLVHIGREKVEAGSTTANRCAVVLDEIVAGVTQVNQMVEEISTACREQAQGVQEINKAMGQLDQVTQQNSSAAQQSATAAEQLRGQTSDLDSVVSTLHQTLQGGSGERAPVATTTTGHSAKTPAPVIPIKAKAKPVEAAPTRSRAKRVVGGDTIPSEDDPRFEDV